jgi:hypothetical protein
VAQTSQRLTQHHQGHLVVFDREDFHALFVPCIQAYRNGENYLLSVSIDRSSVGVLTGAWQA